MTQTIEVDKAFDECWESVSPVDKCASFPRKKILRETKLFVPKQSQNAVKMSTTKMSKKETREQGLEENKASLQFAFEIQKSPNVLNFRINFFSHHSVL